MNLFFDSNVTIGYVFKGDKWNTQSIHIFNCPNKKYYSENVLKETKRKIKIIHQKLFDGFLLIRAELLRDKTIGDYLRLEDMMRFLRRLRFKERGIKRKLEKYITILFSERYSYEVNKDELSRDIQQEADNLMSEIVTNFEFIQDNLSKHGRTNDYIVLGHNLITSHKTFHKEDVDIILDAHDLCHACNPLTLITADSQKERNELVIKLTNIDEVNDLRDFLIHKCP